MGCGLQGKDDRREVVKGGPVTSYQHSGVEGSFLCDFSIHQRGETKISAYPDGQQGSLDLPLKNGRNCKYENESNQQGNLGIFTSSRDHDYCRVSSNSFECGGRLGFSKTRGRGILPVRISPIQPDKQSFMESKEREGSSSIDNSGMANPTLVCHVTSDVSRTSNSPSKNKGSFEGPKWSYTPTSSGEVAKVSGLECFRQSLVAEGISKRASELIGNCRRQGTISSYESTWGKWASWCSNQQIDPIHCPLNYILDYLAHLYESGYAYRTINSYRSTISAYHVEIDNVKVGSHPKVCDLLSGVFNNRPPQPRYTFIWDVSSSRKFSAV